ncbi:MAG: Ig-like domain-containing protein [Mycobacteriales bacterium]
MALSATALAAPAWAAWQAGGSGTGRAIATTLGAATAGSAGNATTTSLDLSWTAPTSPAPSGYVITRDGTAVTCDFAATNLGTAKCRDTFTSSTSARTFAYVVTPKLGNSWSGTAVSFSGSPTTAAGVPAQLSAPTLAAASDSGLSSSDRVTNSTTPTVSGTGAVAGATVKVYLDSTKGQVMASTTAAADGTWSVTSAALADGVHSFTATQTTSGGTSPASAALSITIDTVAPAAPVITSAAMGTTGSKPATIAGTAAEAGGLVTVKVTSAGDTTGATATATPGSTSPYNWSTTVANNALTKNSTQTATATQTDLAGNVSPVSAAKQFST